MAGSESDRQRDEERFAQLSQALLRHMTAAIGPWVRRSVACRAAPELMLLHERAIEQAVSDAETTGTGALNELLMSDIDSQTTNPLAVLRDLVVYPTEVLRSAGVPPVDRDADALRLHPDDPYDLTPAAFSDFGPEVHEAGMMWGAGKAHIHLQRRRSEGQR